MSDFLKTKNQIRLALVAGEDKPEAPLDVIDVVRLQPITENLFIIELKDPKVYLQKGAGGSFSEKEKEKIKTSL